MESDPDEWDFGRLAFAEQCSVVFINGEERTAHFIFRKDNPLARAFDNVIDMEVLRIKRIMQRYKDLERTKRLRSCPIDDPNAPRFKPLGKALNCRAFFEPLVFTGLSPFVGVIMILVGGILTSVLAFVVEKLWTARMRKEN